MGGYPIILELAGRLCTVVGAGPVGCRKAQGLLAAGARVRLVSLHPPVDSDLVTRVELHLRPFVTADLDDATLAFAATGDEATDRAICDAARRRGLPVNAAGQSELGDFTLPAVLRRDALLISVATDGHAPAMASILRDRIADEYGPEWAIVLEIAARLRTRKLTGVDETSYSYAVLDQLLSAGLVPLIAARRTSDINDLLTRVCGGANTLAALGIDLRDTSS